MSKGFRTFIPAANTWGSELFFPTPLSFLSTWELEIAAAQNAFRNSSPSQRAELLRCIAEQLSSEKTSIQALYCQESGLSAARFEAEFSRTTQTLLLFASHLDNSSFEKQTSLPQENKTLFKKRCALGPVLVLGSSNFPLAYSTIGGDSAAALAAGCCVVVKAHPMHVGTSLAVANCVKNALAVFNLPTAIFSHVIDNSYQWASTLAQHPAIKAIGFTGSIKGGRALMDLAAQRLAPIPVFAEMGSLNPVVVSADLPENQLAAIAQKLAVSICTDAGQFCTKPGLLLVANKHLATFKAELLKALHEQPATVMLHPDIFQKYEARKRQVFQTKGVTPHQGKQLQIGIQGRWGLAQTTLATLAKEGKLLEEVFGPFSVLCAFENEMELSAVFEKLGGQLTFSIFTTAPNNPAPILTEFINEKVGRVILNGVPTGVSVVEAMQHGGAYPAASDARFSAVGPDSILRFSKEICWQVHH
ncbi:MAG: aldehyde dehydrogenase family protein [Flavobacteriales bacterium]